MSNFESLKRLFDDRSFQYETASLIKLPSTFIDLKDDDKKKFLNLYEKLEDDEDVQEVFSNANFE